MIKNQGIILESVKVKNFGSFSNVWTEFDLCNTGTTLIIGENVDLGVSSGAGKTTLINAVSYALYDKVPSKVSKDRLINRTNDKKTTTMEVELTLSKSTDKYVIKRWRGSSTGCQLLINDNDMTPASVNRGEDSFNAKIEEIIGFSYTLFSQIILFDGTADPFLNLSVSAQRDFIEELFKITMLSKKAIALKKMISDNEKNISLKKLLVQQQQKQNESHRKHVSDANDRITKWDTQCVIELEKIQTKLDSSCNIDFDAEESILNEITIINSEVTKIQAHIRELTITDQSITRELTAKKQSEIREITTKKNAKQNETCKDVAILVGKNKDLKMILEDIKKYEIELSKLNEAICPYCAQQFHDVDSNIIDVSSKIDNCKKTKDLLQIEIDKLEDNIEVFDLDKQEELYVLHELITKLNQVDIVDEDASTRKSEIDVEKLRLGKVEDQLDIISNKTLYNSISELNKVKNEVVVLQSRLETMISETNPHTDAYNELINEGEIEIDNDGLDNLIKIQEHQQFLLKLLVDKNSFIRKNIISKTIPFLNKRIMYYSTKLNLPHIVSFQSDMTCEISEFSRDIDHGNLSNGEKKKLNLSLTLAFRDVLTYLHNKVNVLFTDEVDAGVISGMDLEKLIEVLQAKSEEDKIGIFIVSHRTEFDNKCDQTITIRKEHGFSSLIKE